MNKKTILVTGGAGFIGSHTIKKLNSLGYGIILVDNFNKYYDPKLKENRINVFLKDCKFKLYRMDICDYKKLKQIFLENKVDIICHLAAQAGVRYSLENPFVYGETNFNGTLNLFELAKEFKIEGIIYASSSSVYGKNTKMPFSETDVTDSPISLYAATKKATELLAHSYNHLFNVKSTGLRFFTVYGPWGRPDMALFKFTKNILENKPVDIYGMGKMKRDFTYIDDIVAGIIKCIEKNYDYEIFNLGYGKPVDLMDYVGLVEKVLDKKAEINFMDMQPGDVRQTYSNISKAKEKLDWIPKFPVETGVKNFIKWYINYYK